MFLLSPLNQAWWVLMWRGERFGYLQLICIFQLIYIFNKKNAAMRCGLKVWVWFPTQPLPCMRSLHVLTCLLVELGVELLFWIETIMDSNNECWCWGNITAHCCCISLSTLSPHYSRFRSCFALAPSLPLHPSLILSIIFSPLSNSLSPLFKSLHLSLPMFLSPSISL